MVRRYSVVPGADAIEETDGTFITYDDYAALAKELSDAKAQRYALCNAIKEAMCLMEIARGHHIDGTDIDPVMKVAQAALKRAGGGP